MKQNIIKLSLEMRFFCKINVKYVALASGTEVGGEKAHTVSECLKYIHIMCKRCKAVCKALPYGDL